MSAAEAAALGMTIEPAPDGEPCQTWSAVDATPLEVVVVNAEHGVVAIHPEGHDWLRTPEGMRVGWTADQVHAAYPSFDPAQFDYPHGPTVPAPGNPAAQYRMQFDGAGVLVRFILEAVADPCSA